MGPAERRQRERDDTRQRILDAARDLFITEGYDGVSMRRVAEKIEYTPTAIYFHFRDKETLISELCDHDFLILAQQFASAALIPDPIDRLRATGLGYARFGLQNRNHYRLMFMTPHAPLDEHDSTLRKGNPEEDAYAFLKSIVAEAIAKKRFRKEYMDADLIAQTMWAGVHGVVSLEIAKCNDDWVIWADIEQRVTTMIDILVDGLTAQPSSKKAAPKKGRTRG